MDNIKLSGLSDDMAAAEADVNDEAATDVKAATEEAYPSRNRFPMHKLDGFKNNARKASRDNAAKLAEEAIAAEDEAVDAHMRIIEEEEKVANMKEGPKKMLKLKALKAAQMTAQKKADEAEALREDAAEEDDEDEYIEEVRPSRWKKMQARKKNSSFNKVDVNHDGMISPEEWEVKVQGPGGLLDQEKNDGYWRGVATGSKTVMDRMHKSKTVNNNEEKEEEEGVCHTEYEELLKKYIDTEAARRSQEDKIAEMEVEMRALQTRLNSVLYHTYAKQSMTKSGPQGPVETHYVPVTPPR